MFTIRVKIVNRVKIVDMTRRTSKYRVRFHRHVQLRLAQQHRAVINVLKDVPVRQPPTQNNEQHSHDKEFVGDSIKKIRSWSMTHNITHRALSALLKILPTFGVSWLPLDARTILRTPQNIEIVESANGKLWYNGIRNNVQKIFEYTDKNLELDLNFNIDGIPLFNSAKKEFWPILANIHSMCIYLKRHKFI